MGEVVTAFTGSPLCQITHRKEGSIFTRLQSGTLEVCGGMSLSRKGKAKTTTKVFRFIQKRAPFKRCLCVLSIGKDSLMQRFVSTTSGVVFSVDLTLWLLELLAGFSSLLCITSLHLLYGCLPEALTTFSHETADGCVFQTS